MPLLVRPTQCGTVLRLGTAWLGVVLSEQVHEIERRLKIRITTKLVKHGGDAEGAEVRRQSARDIGLDPFRHRHPVELLPAGCVLVVELRPRRGFEGGLMKELPSPVMPVLIEVLL